MASSQRTIFACLRQYPFMFVFGTRSVSSRANFLPYEAARDYIQSLGFRSTISYRDWARGGSRPPFIPSNPDSFYKNDGWISYQQWLGYERQPSRRSLLFRPSPKKCQDLLRAKEVRSEFVDFIRRERSDIDVVELRSGLPASHLFRIGNPSVDQWLPLQIRYAGPNVRVDQQYIIKHSADPDTGVIVVAHTTGNVHSDLQRNMKTCVREREFRPRTTVFGYLESWWAFGSRLPQTEMAEYLLERRVSGMHTVDVMFRSLNRLKEEYFDPMGLTVQVTLHLPGYVCAIVDGKYRLIVRTPTIEGPQFRVNLHRSAGRTISSSEDAFDFLVCIFPESLVPVDTAQPSPLFVFPKATLQEWEVLQSGDCPGKSNLYVDPPFRRLSRLFKRTVSRKKEQAPFYVTSREEMEAMLRSADGAVGPGPADAAGAE